MKGEISESGCLVIYRASIAVTARCDRDKNSPCHHSCAHFKEPRQALHGSGGTTLEICNGTTWFFSDFEDKRK